MKTAGINTQNICQPMAKCLKIPSWDYMSLNLLTLRYTYSPGSISDGKLSFIIHQILRLKGNVYTLFHLTKVTAFSKTTEHVNDIKNEQMLFYKTCTCL